MDERKEFEAWARTQADSWLIVGGLTWSPGTGDYASARTNAAWASWQARADLAAQPATQGPTMNDAIAAGDGTLHGAIDHWQTRALEAERKLSTSAEPGDEELLKWAGEEQFFLFCDEDEFLQIARALLQRYGRPAGDADEYQAMLAVMEQIDPATFPGLTTVQRCALGRFAKPVSAQKADDARDAERYRWLRERDLDVIVDGGVFAGQVPDNVVLNGIDLDSAIDAAMAGSGAHHD